MVVYACVATNIKDIVSDPVDIPHQLVYTNTTVCVTTRLGRDDFLNFLTGDLYLGDIQLERTVGETIDGGYGFGKNTFCTMLHYSKGVTSNMPLIFELERIAKESVVIKELRRLNADGTKKYKQDDIYFLREKVGLERFIQHYSAAVKSSTIQRPALEGFYMRMKDINLERLQGSIDSTKKEVIRDWCARNFFTAEDFEAVFGGIWFEKLSDALGEPIF